MLGLHADEASAGRVFDAGVDAVPYLAGAAESWSGVLEPITFTRLEVLDQQGTWLGGDPLAW